MLLDFSISAPSSTHYTSPSCCHPVNVAQGLWISPLQFSLRFPLLPRLEFWSFYSPGLGCLKGTWCWICWECNFPYEAWCQEIWLGLKKSKVKPVVVKGGKAFYGSVKFCKPAIICVGGSLSNGLPIAFWQSLITTTRSNGSKVHPLPLLLRWLNMLFSGWDAEFFVWQMHGLLHWRTSCENTALSRSQMELWTIRLPVFQQVRKHWAPLWA